MKFEDEEISSEEENNSGASDHEDDDASLENEESAEDKRRRLAKQYLGHMAEGEEGTDGTDDDDQHLSERLKTSRMRSKGEYFEDISSTLANLDVPTCSRQEWSGHKGSLTTVAVTKDESAVYSGSKDNSVIRWDIETGSKQILKQKWDSKQSSQNSSSGEILSVAVTHDDRYAVSAGRDQVIRVFDSRLQYSEVRALSGHRDTITSLAFRMDSYTLFSGSLDRCLKHWDLNDMAYIETLFGHQVWECYYLSAFYSTRTKR